MGPTLRYFHKADEPENGPELIDEGLGYIDFVILPHFNREKYKKELLLIEGKLIKEGFKTRRLTDNEVIIVNTDNKR